MYEQALSYGRSFVRLLDPRTRLLAAAIAAVCFSCLRTTPAAWAALACSLLLLFMARPPLRPLFKRLAVVNCFILFLWLTVPLTMSGPNAFTLGPLHFSKAGLTLALLVSVKCNAIFLAFIALAGGISVPQTGYALERMRVPAKLVFLLLFTYRYIHAIGEEWHRLQLTARLRGFVARNNMHTYRTIAYMLGLVFVNSYDRAQRIYEAMLLRGFHGSFHTVAELAYSRRDLFFTALLGLSLLGVAVLDLFPERLLYD